ncbi:MAG: hypothetical protein NUW37_16720 [Planctomycetes bacterium]|nr:hypothetical protein [Planctomycetota bacterium]
MPAVDYIDPGSGTILLQVLLSALLGAIVYFRRVIPWTFRRLLIAVRRKSRDANP